MKILVDTNVIIDVLEKREPFFQDSYNIIRLGLEGELETIMSAGAITDAYYIINKHLHDQNTAREKIFILGNLIKICKSTSDDVTGALILFIPDFEDAVIAAIAKREKANFIITRNDADFSNSPVPALSPSLFLRQFFPEY